MLFKIKEILKNIFKKNNTYNANTNDRNIKTVRTKSKYRLTKLIQYNTLSISQYVKPIIHLQIKTKT